MLPRRGGRIEETLLAKLFLTSELGVGNGEVH